jgi:hypothetical protein
VRRHRLAAPLESSSLNASRALTSAGAAACLGLVVEPEGQGEYVVGGVRRAPVGVVPDGPAVAAGGEGAGTGRTGW